MYPRIALPPRIALALVVVALTSSFSASAEARCRRGYVSPQLLSPTDRALAADAALVVRMVASPRGSNTNAMPTLVLVRGSEMIQLRLEPLTASLARYVPVTRPSAGHWEVEGLGQRVEWGTHRAPALAAPIVTEVDSFAENGRRRGSNYRVTAMLSTRAPSGVLAVFAKHAAASYGDGRVGAGDLELPVFVWRTRCQPWPENMTPPPQTGNVRLRFVGEDGQLSSPSNEVPLT